MAESLKDLTSWARHMDQGIRQLECVAKRNGFSDSDVDPCKVMQKIQVSIDDAKANVMLARKDVDQLRHMSDELKNVLLITESEEFLKINDELNTMMNSLFPKKTKTGGAAPVDETAQGIEGVAAPAVDEEKTASALAMCLVPNQSNPDESYTEVEFTPGLVSKVPKSQLSNGDAIPSSERVTHFFLRPMRKKTLVFSPGERSYDTASDSTISNQNTPKIVLQDCSNWSSETVRTNTKNSEFEETTIDSPEIVERPTKPVLSKIHGRLH